MIEVDRRSSIRRRPHDGHVKSVKEASERKAARQHGRARADLNRAASTGLRNLVDGGVEVRRRDLVHV